MILSAANGVGNFQPWWRVGDACGTKWFHFFAYPPAVRKLIYTTNAIESLHSQLRKIIKTRGHFPSDDAATKLLWLALRNIAQGKSIRDWRGIAEPLTTNKT
jgi:transposase-like protein